MVVPYFYIMIYYVMARSLQRAEVHNVLGRTKGKNPSSVKTPVNSPCPLTYSANIFYKNDLLEWPVISNGGGC